MTTKEQRYLDFYADPKKRYFHHPGNFCLSNGRRYTPDFYCVEDDTYIEIVGSRQAYHQNKTKYRILEAEFPNITFQIIQVGVWKKPFHDRQWKDDPVTSRLRPLKVKGPVAVIAAKYHMPTTAIKHILMGIAYTKNIPLIFDLAEHSKKKPISFINPKFRYEYIHQITEHEKAIAA